MTFRGFARLSGVVPLIGIAAGRCFAGNAALLGCCDVAIVVEGASIGIGGPAMIEGAGLGRYTPEEVGPLDVQSANGVVDRSIYPIFRGSCRTGSAKISECCATLCPRIESAPMM
jgi:acetyl-CoA carboxylase carboxyltransferase component